MSSVVPPALRAYSMVRTNYETENVLLAAIQAFAIGSETAHTYGTLPGNKIIGGWWSFLRRSRSQRWIDLFQQLIDVGAFNPRVIHHTDCLRFCFMEIL